MPCSLAWIPYCTVCPDAIWATWEPRADPGLAAPPPVYQKTVLAGVPFTSDVAVSKGGPLTRNGGESKKLLEASIAEDATKAVFATVLIDEVRAVCKFEAVAAGVAPIVNDPDGGGDVVVAVSCTVCVVPSGMLKVKLTLSPGLGLAAPSATDIVAGDPVGPVTVAPVSVELTEFSFMPKGEPATSSASETEVVVGADTTRRPRPLAPRS